MTGVIPEHSEERLLGPASNRCWRQPPVWSEFIRDRRHTTHRVSPDLPAAPPSMPGPHIDARAVPRCAQHTAVHRASPDL